ncbi:MAG: DsbC family protein [Burkholderiales bacterium]|nr:DsbC family protein [Burkholderiales bacterium]
MNKTRTVLGAAALLAACAVMAQAPTPEAVIRKNLSERIPQLRQIDEVTKTPMPGVWEVRVGADLYYSDAEGNFVIEGHLMDARTRKDLTEERQNKLTAVDFDKLPLKDAFVITRGNGSRKVALFEDPNCGYCKRMERDLQKVDNIAIYIFLYPILGRDSLEKSRDIWCAKEPAKAWLDWMVRDVRPAQVAQCEAAALVRNVEMGRRYKITGTPTLVLADGTKVPGALNAAQLEKLLAAQK